MSIENWVWQLQGRRDVNIQGGYRTHSEPMPIVSGPDYDRKIHFEAPPSTQVNDEMDKFLHWFDDTSPTGSQPLGPLTRAAIAHVWFECIHPFEDGNGRIGRAIAEKAIAQSIGSPTISSLRHVMLERRKQYYAALAKINRSSQIQDWLTRTGERKLTRYYLNVASVLSVIK